MLVEREIAPPAWVGRRGLPGPVYVVTHVAPRQMALVLCIPAVILAAVGATERATVFAGLTALGLAFVGIGTLAAARYRLLAGPSWIGSESLLGRRVVRLAELTRIDSYYDKAVIWIRLYDARGGHLALSHRSMLPRVRDAVVAAVAAHPDVTVDDVAARQLGLS